MRRYETIFIVRSNIAEDEIEAAISKASSIIEGDGGTIIKIDKWGLKKLAYLIKKESQGYYVYIDYAGIPASVSEMERIFRIDDKILKYLTVKLADSCDPDAIKEELASTEDGVKEEESSPSESAKTSTEDKAKKEESSPSESAKTSTEDEAKKEESSPSESAEATAEDEVTEEESSPSEEKQAD